VATPLERLENTYAEAMEAPDAIRFFWLLDDYLHVLKGGPIARAVKKLTKEVESAAAEHEQRDAEYTRRLVEIRNELVRVEPNADDSDAPKPPAYDPTDSAAANEWHEWTWTLANFDAVVVESDDAIKSEKEGDRSTSRVAGEILDAKVHGLMYPGDPNQKARDDLDDVQMRLRQVRGEQVAAQRKLEHVAEKTGFLARRKLEEIAAFLAPKEARQIAERGSDDDLKWVNDLFKEALGGFAYLRESMRPKEFREDLDAKAEESIERLMDEAKEALERAHRPLRRRLEEKRFTSWGELRPGDKVAALVGVAGIVASVIIAIAA
jgi:hypothetical protein